MTIRVQREDFDIAAEVDALKRANNATGSVVTFTGVVRDDDGLSSLTLEHYPGMTEREIGAHVAEAKSRWPLTGVTVIHRIGRLRVGDNIVLVAVTSAHRQAAFAAAEFLMDYVKTRAPFWKQEQRGHSTKWVNSREQDQEAAIRWLKD
ncbi:MAG: molybdopterin synthase catalytic subunit MoaE [Alphaproteobacteria bacterium]|jgi:molybdopterin synthase catalytic subunit